MPLGQNGTDGITNSDATFAAASANFTAGDVGRELVIVGHGIYPIVDTATYKIMSVVSSTSVTLESRRRIPTRT